MHCPEACTHYGLETHLFIADVPPGNHTPPLLEITKKATVFRSSPLRKQACGYGEVYVRAVWSKSPGLLIEEAIYALRIVEGISSLIKANAQENSKLTICQAAA